jgi:hypothetical protein
MSAYTEVPQPRLVRRRHRSSTGGRMSEPTSPPQSEFLREMQRLHDWQMNATNADDRQEATDAMALFLRYHHTGRLDEYFARQAQENA